MQKTPAAIAGGSPRPLPRSIRCGTGFTRKEMSKRHHPEFASTCRSVAIRALLLRCANSGRVSMQDRWGGAGPTGIPSLPGTRHIARANSAGLCANVRKEEGSVLRQYRANSRRHTALPYCTRNQSLRRSRQSSVSTVGSRRWNRGLAIAVARSGSSRTAQLCAVGEARTRRRATHHHSWQSAAECEADGGLRCIRCGRGRHGRDWRSGRPCQIRRTR